MEITLDFQANLMYNIVETINRKTRDGGLFLCASYPSG